MKNKNPKRTNQIRSLIIQEVANYFNEHWLESNNFLSLFDVILSPDLEDANFLFTVNDVIEDEQKMIKKINSKLQDCRKFLFTRLDLKKMPKFNVILSDNKAFEGFKDEII